MEFNIAKNIDLLVQWLLKRLISTDRNHNSFDTHFECKRIYITLQDAIIATNTGC